ncbi:hypothetical protein Mth01_05910 [Sphaerimonospora thailandensis]|uniref:Uncharacterized protein n=1 Tax=Sphaerimonospora thailandensis TaxID=795644 RepID=A0A8J3R970_9ACTN|nr:hypothetical protein Mth01_05910 [Sphaerimonospora thailandensis]
MSPLPDEPPPHRSGASHLRKSHGTDRWDESFLPGDRDPGHDSRIIFTQQGERLGIQHQQRRRERDVRTPHSPNHARLASSMTSSDKGPTRRSWSVTISSAFSSAKPYSAA